MKIKAEPEHFFVKEISKKKVSKSGEQAYVLLRKRNYTTARAISAVSRALRVSIKRIGVAGNKDKFALTEQIISIWKVKKEDIEKINLKDIELEFLGYSDERITLGDLDGNAFKITVFCDKNDECDFEVLKKRAKEIEKKGIPNYFGEQRFGIGGNNAEVGKHFLKGDFESAVRGIFVKKTSSDSINSASEFIDSNWGKWKECLAEMPQHMSMEKAILNHLVKTPNDYAGAFRVLQKNLRRIFIHAYQSMIWNSALSAEFPDAKSVIKVAGAKLSVKGIIKAQELPLIGFESKDDKSIFFKNSIKLIEKDELSIESFKLPRMPELASEGSFRPSLSFPSKIAVKKKAANEFEISFELDKGSYATIFLAILFAK